MCICFQRMILKSVSFFSIAVGTLIVQPWWIRRVYSLFRSSHSGTPVPSFLSFPSLSVVVAQTVNVNKYMCVRVFVFQCSQFLQIYIYKKVLWITRRMADAFLNVRLQVLMIDVHSFFRGKSNQKCDVFCGKLFFAVVNITGPVCVSRSHLLTME